MWSLFELFRRRLIAAVRPASAKRKSPARRWRPLLEVLEDRTVPSTLSIASNFNGTGIPRGSTLWFASVVNVSGVASSVTNIYVTNQTITFSDTLNGVTTPYTLSVPNAVLTLSASATTATTTFNTSTNTWMTTSPTGLPGNEFLAGYAMPCPNGLGGGDNPVTWSATFSTDTTGVSLNWQWATAVYTNFSTTYSALGVKPCDSNTASSYSNSDHAGTPETYKPYVTGGVRGGGGSNYTGSYSATASVTPTVQSTFITGTVFNDLNGDGQQESNEPGLSGWTVQLYTQTNGTLSSSPLQTTTSGALGEYSLSDLAVLANGTSYVVAEVPPAGWLQTNPTSSTPSTTLLPSGQRGYVYPVNNGSVLMSNGSSTTAISGTGTLVVNNYTDTAGTVTYNDDVGDSGTESTVFSQLSDTFTPSSGSPITFYTYCIDLWHNVSVGQSVSVYVSGNESTAYVNGSRMAYIYEMYGTQNLSGNPNQGAAVQLALWDLSMNDHNPTTFGLDADGTYSSGDESIYSVSFSNPTIAAPVAALVNQYLQASIGATMQGGWFNAAANGTGVNRGQSMPIPAPVYNFSETQPVTVGGTVYQDTNANGVLDSGEPGIGGVTLTLSGTNSLGQSITATTTTAANGTYNFTTDSNGNSLLAGTYQIAETAPSGYLQIAANVGTVNGSVDGTKTSAVLINSIALTSGQSGINYDFGDVKPITISGLVYQDTHDTGVFNSASDPGLAGVTLTLSGTNGLGQSITATTTTAANGTYSFSTDSNGNVLKPGTYQITDPPPSGYMQGADAVGTVNGTTDGTLVPMDTIGSIVVTSGQSGINYNFSALQPVTLSGTVYLDANANGVLDSGEPGIAGVTLTLSGTNGLGQSITATTTTAANGTYSFTTASNGNALLPGTYQIAETAPSGYLQGANNVGTVNGATDGTLVPMDTIGSIVVTSGQSGINYNFSDLKPVTISGTVYQDTNGTGVYSSSDPGIAGVTLTLSGTNGLGQAVTATTTTAANGTYSFTTTSNGSSLLPGTYQITETQPNGYLAGATTVGTVNAASDGTVVSTGMIGSIALTSGQSGINYNFGNVKPVTISGTVYVDANGTGVYSSSDPGIAAVTLTLSGTNGLGQSITATAITAANGTYSFSTDGSGNALRPGAYQITETQPSGYLAGATAVGTVNGTNDGTVVATGKIGSIALASGQAGINYDFGEVQPVTISGTVYQDTNGTGVYNSSDAGIAGVTLTLSGTNGLGQSITATTTTAANGTYSFATASNGNALLPGTYQITETQPTGYLAGTTAVGTVNGTSDGTVVSTGKIGSIVETSGQSGINYNFGDVKAVTLSGTVYLDANASGVLVSGDAGISGVTLTLSGTNGLGQSIMATTTTAANGTYSFTTDSNGNALRPGTYQIAETAPSGYLQGANTVGTVSGATDGTLVPVDKIGSIVETSGQSGISYNFGWVQAVTISGLVYQDTNANGVLDSGEPGIAGVTLTLSGTNNLGQSVSATATTAANGTYSFVSSVAPGTYQIAETTPSGYAPVAANLGTVNGTADGIEASPVLITTIVETSGQSGINYDFGDVKAITISGTVYQDTKGTGAYSASDPGIAGVTVTLSGTNGLSQSITATTTTAANGTYSFSLDSNGNALLPGTYQVTETPPSGYLAGATAVGTVNGTGDGTVVATGEIGSIALTSGQSGINYNFGEVQPVAVSGIVYVDTNGTGTYSASDPDLAGITVTLTGTNGLGQSITATTSTGSNGTYSFSTDGNGNALRPGTYQVTETPPNGYLAGATAVGTVNGTSDGTVVSTGQIGSIALTSGQSGVNYDFGEVQPVTVSGLVYLDPNGLGVYTGSDSGFANVTVTLSGTNGLGQSITATTTTASNGSYSFSTDSHGNALRPGTYQITATTPTGYVAVAANVGTVSGTVDGNEASPSSISGIGLTSGQSGINYDFGVSIPAAASGYVYIDYDGSRTFDSNNAPSEGQTVVLTGTTNAGLSVSMTTTTAVDGYYVFTGLANGTYSISLKPPGGLYDPDAANVGTVNGTTDGTANANLEEIDQVQLHAGQTGLNYDFGLKPPVE